MVTSEAPERPSSHRHTKCTATHTEVPSEKHPETSQVTPTHRQMTQYPHRNRWESRRQPLTISPNPSTATYNRKGTPSSQLFPEEKLGLPHLAPQLLRLPI